MNHRYFLLLLLGMCTWLHAQDLPSGNMKVYQNFDFIAGEHVLFEDEFLTDTDGEFPAHWSLMAGQAVVNTFGGRRVLAITDGSYGRVAPRMKTANYLSKSFTLEFDIYFPSDQDSPDRLVMFYGSGETYGDLIFGKESVRYNSENISLTSNYPTELTQSWENAWHHVSIAYLDRQMKVYVDQHRVMVVPSTGLDILHLELASVGSADGAGFFSRIKMADGGNMNMLNKITTDGKIVTHGITFDVGKSTLRPESMGVINSIYSLLKDNPTLKVEIRGHTDSDGDDASNLKLSQQRADAVKTLLVSMGIDATRLSTKGMGESQPIDANTTPEGKANNRRVEFVKI